jgi:hypothetical protein
MVWSAPGARERRPRRGSPSGSERRPPVVEELVVVGLVGTLILPAAAAVVLATPIARATDSVADFRASITGDDLTQTCNRIGPADDPETADLLDLYRIEVPPDALVGVACLGGRHAEQGTVVCGPLGHDGVLAVPVREGACDDEP